MTDHAIGDKVKKGQLLIKFDIDKIKQASYPVITPVVVTNFNDYRDIIPTESKSVKQGEILISTIV